jgi:hypothetical protein
VETNVNYLIDTDRRRQLDSILNSYNLFSMINFPTRNQNGSNIAIDNNFIDTNAFTNFKIIPIINELSDHTTQLLIIQDLYMRIGTNYIKSKRKMDEYLMLEFQIRLRYVVWENVFNTTTTTTSKTKTSHLLYMDDWKLTAKSEEELQKQIQRVKTFSVDIHMESGLEKCAKITLKGGKLIHSQNLVTEINREIQELQQGKM